MLSFVFLEVPHFAQQPQEKPVLSLGFLCTDGVANATCVQLRIGAMCWLSDMVIFQNCTHRSESFDHIPKARGRGSLWSY